jgi:phage repressor protein C with HTH and peptisase S24 domain
MVASRFETFIRRVKQATCISSLNKISVDLGVHRSSITQARKRDSIPAKWILQLFRKHRLNPDWLESGTGPQFLNSSEIPEDGFVRIPKVRARLCAGNGSFEVGSGIEGYYSFRRDWLSKKGSIGNMTLLDIVGNSMEPELKNGDTILVDKSQKEILAGAVYAVGIEDTIMVKRVEKHPSGLVLLSDNPKYGPISPKRGDPNRIRIIGKVIWVCREFK